MNVEKYLKHLPTCNTSQDWTPAIEALSDTPEQFKDEAWHSAYEEMRTKMATCTCGLAEIKDRFFSVDEIRKMQESHYDAGWQAAIASETF